jgi:hypothetical protein
MQWRHTERARRSKLHVCLRILKIACLETLIQCVSEFKSGADLHIRIAVFRTR